MEAMGDDVAQYPIGVVAHRTGLSTHVLRAWERRYEVVEPARSEGGVRLYSNADIVRLRLLRRLTEQGHSIGRVAGLDTGALVALVREEGERGGKAAGPRVDAEHFVVGCLTMVEQMDAVRIHAELTRAALALSPLEFAEEVAAPLLRRVGELWSEGQLCPAHEHLMSVCMQRVLSWLLANLPSEPGAPLLLCTTMAGELHELGSLLAAVVAADAGWRVAYFGPDLPVEDIARAAELTGARAVALSRVHAVADGALRRELEALRASLPGSVPLYLGGSGVGEDEGLEGLGVECFHELRSLRAALAERAGRGARQ